MITEDITIHIDYATYILSVMIRTLWKWLCTSLSLYNDSTLSSSLSTTCHLWAPLMGLTTVKWCTDLEVKLGSKKRSRPLDLDSTQIRVVKGRRSNCSCTCTTILRRSRPYIADLPNTPQQKLIGSSLQVYWKTMQCLKWFIVLFRCASFFFLFSLDPTRIPILASMRHLWEALSLQSWLSNPRCISVEAFPWPLPRSLQNKLEITRGFLIIDFLKNKFS